MAAIRRVDGTRCIETLESLHRAILPSDQLPDFDKGWWWIATNDGKPVAFAGMHPSTQWWDTLYLCRSGVLPLAQGKGLQLRLIKARERHAKTLGKTWLITDTRENPASANSLIKADFRLYEPAAPWSFRTALYWRKRIA